MDKLSLNDLTGLDTAGADQSPLNSLVDDDFDALQVGHNTTEGLADYFRTGTAFFLFHTASSVFSSRRGFFIANDTDPRHF